MATRPARTRRRTLARVRVQLETINVFHSNVFQSIVTNYTYTCCVKEGWVLTHVIKKGRVPQLCIYRFQPKGFPYICKYHLEQGEPALLLRNYLTGYLVSSFSEVSCLKVNNRLDGKQSSQHATLINNEAHFCL